MKFKPSLKLNRTRIITALATVFIFTNILVFANYNNVPKEKINFELEDINGKIWDSKQLEGSVVVFNFWFTACPPCKKEIPELNKLVEKYSNKEVVFIAVALDETDEVLKFTDIHPFKYNIIPDGADFIDGNHVSSFPTQFIVDKEGYLSKRIVGAVTFEEIEEQLNATLGL